MISILFVSKHSYLPDRTGGLEVSTHELCSALRKDGINVAVLCVGSRRGSIVSDAPPPFGLSKDDELGYPVYRADDPAIVLGTVAALQSADATVLHMDQSLALAYASELANLATVFYLRDVQFGSEAWRLQRAPRAAFVANSFFCAQRAHLELGLDCEVIYPLVQREKYEVQSIGKHIIFVNPVPKKGVEIALNLASLRPQIPFVFVEGWPVSNAQRDFYRNRALKLPNVTWCKRTSDMREIYSTARILLVPSVWEESFGRVVVESQMSGIPSIVSRRGGLPESVLDGGIIVDKVGDISQWLAAIDRLWYDDSLYDAYSMAARLQSQRSQLTAQEILNKFKNLVCQTCSR